MAHSVEKHPGGIKLGGLLHSAVVGWVRTPGLTPSGPAFHAGKAFEALYIPGAVQ